MNIGKSIKVACAKREINQVELAKLSGMSEATISNLVGGKTQCKQKTLEKLAKVFEIPASEFIALGE